jgi:hypothetical protein
MLVVACSPTSSQSPTLPAPEPRSESSTSVAAADTVAPWPGTTAVRNADLPRLRSDGSLAIGESLIAFDVGTHCGVEWLSIPINGQLWRAIDLEETDAAGIDLVPSAWGQANDRLDLVVTLIDATTLEVTSPGTDVVVTYVPGDDFPGCD